MSVPPGGYAWWYIDGVSDDGNRSLSVIGFIGTVFSPWYAWSGRGDPEDHCCVNVATYGPGGRFTMTDRGRDRLRRASDRLEIGPSAMAWRDGALHLTLDEWAAPPIPGRVRGDIILRTAAVTGVEVPLTPDGAHVWRPFAPVARIEVRLDRPGWHWQGHGYFDANFGTRPLERDFKTWTWARFPTAGGALCLYDAARRDGSTLDAAIRFDRSGHAETVKVPTPAALPRSFWRLDRSVRADPGSRPRDLRMMLDAPFYTRAEVSTRIDGEALAGVHEALDLDRYAHPVVKAMVACRVPRRR